MRTDSEAGSSFSWQTLFARAVTDHTSADEKFSHIAMVCYPACIIAEPHFHVVQGVLHSSAVSESYYLRIRVVDALNLFCLPSSAIVDS